MINESKNFIIGKVKFYNTRQSFGFIEAKALKDIYF